MPVEFIPGRDVTSELARAVGLDPVAMPIRSITIHSEVGDAVAVDVRLFVQNDQIGPITEILRRYRIEGGCRPDDLPFSP